jgi:hypothetical protein
MAELRGELRSISSGAHAPAADIRPVLSDFSRRRLLQAGSVFGLLSLVGCASQQNANADPPSPPWPTEPIAPPMPRNQPVITQAPTPAPGPRAQAPEPLPTKPVMPLPAGVIPRTRWTTAALANPANARPMNGVNRITVHHDGMGAFFSEDIDDSMKRLRSIRESHSHRNSKMGERWADIGYHYIIDRGGRVFEGRPLYYQGAHVEDENEHNIGVMCMGNFEIQTPSKIQTDRLDAFVASLMREHRISLRAVRTHKEWPSARTECPGANLQQYMTRTRGRGGAMALALAQSDPALIA